MIGAADEFNPVRAPRVSTAQAAAAAEAEYGLTGALTRLDGERDLNYRLDAPDGNRYALKIAHRDERAALLHFQRKVFARLARARVFAQAPESIDALDGAPFASVVGADGARHMMRVLRYLDGRLLSAVNPHQPALLQSLGECVARVGCALNDADDADDADYAIPLRDDADALARPLLWELHRADEVIARFAPLLESDAQRELVGYFAALYRSDALAVQSQLRRGIIHNDANDRNVLVGGDGPWSQRVLGLIDFGDIAASWRAADPAIAAAYAMLGKARPLDAACAVVRGYHRHHPLREAEISALFALMCARLCMSVCICARQRALAPDNAYLRVSEQPAWETLQKLRLFSPRFAHFVLRDACGLTPVPQSPTVVAALRAHGERAGFAPVIDVDLAREPLLILDASVSSPDIGSPGAPTDPAVQTRLLQRAIEDSGSRAAVGRYDEHRLIYASDAFKEPSGHRRTLHLGIDLFQPAGALVSTPLAGTVHSVADHGDAFDYGGVLIVAHTIEDDDGAAVTFHTLYGHLAPASLAQWSVGDAVAAGQTLARLGAVHENGGWPPHLHFQLITDLLTHPLQPRRDTFVGVGTHQHRAVWRSLCPDPNLLLGIPPRLLQPDAPTRDAVLHARRRDLGAALRLSHRRPIELARGAMQYLYDVDGQRYLDAVNNVQQVGHCHPRVVAAERRQCGVLNTNTRYLHAAMARYTERLLRTFPPQLCVCYLVCSGSEANDLALRLARAYTARRGVVVLDGAYHGNLGALIDASPYKHADGARAPAHVQVAKMPDVYRGAFSDAPDAAARYAADVRRAFDAADAAGQGAAAFLAESALGCGGQIVLPPGYLRAAYAHARRAGAVCIADEVQVGFARVGSHFWGFETQAAVPDIVTLGKPIGNGYPMGAVITTREIAARFDDGMEYFNTFGGNPVACAVGEAVLDAIEHDRLQDNARRVGGGLQDMLRALQPRFGLIGDVRGLGLFIGVELVRDEQRTPAPEQAAYIAERMKCEGVLIGVDGPQRNVLKIKPPLCFNEDDANMLTQALARILREDFAQPDAA